MARLRSMGAMALAVLAGCSPDADEPPPLPLPSPGIAMESRLGTSLVRSFNVDGHGDGALREAMIGADTFDYDIVTRRFHGGPEGFARLRAIIGQIDRKFAGTGASCEPDSAADSAYRVRWRWGNEFGQMVFRFRCRDDVKEGEIFGLFNDLEREVWTWAEPMPIAERYPVIGSR